jgi:hypothetical protein
MQLESITYTKTSAWTYSIAIQNTSTMNKAIFIQHKINVYLESKAIVQEMKEIPRPLIRFITLWEKWQICCVKQSSGCCCDLLTKTTEPMSSL